jgi:hypothetical protein
MRRVEMLEVPVGQDETFVPGIARNGDGGTVAVYARHKPDCPNKGNPYWRKCRCTKYLYIYANGSSRQISAKTRSWREGRGAEEAEVPKAMAASVSSGGSGIKSPPDLT